MLSVSTSVSLLHLPPYKTDGFWFGMRILGCLGVLGEAVGRQGAGGVGGEWEGEVVWLVWFI